MEPLGATPLGNGRCGFCVWAPRAETVEIHLLDPVDRIERLLSTVGGYHAGVLSGVEPGTLYYYRLDGGKERPDPASRFQPRGVHTPSQVIDPAFNWTDQNWYGLPLSDYILYEIHVGTFTPEGTFEAIIPHLDELRSLGISALELMPVAQFPGKRNWGYDGVHPFAVQDSYGGPAGLKHLVDQCHRRGLAVVLDVVYNHLGPEGNYLDDFGPYFTNAYRTPWGSAVNFDGPHSDEVRRYFIENALYWLTDFHIDALRLDAIHAIKDFSARPFLAELATAAADRAERLNRRFYLIAESNLNDSRVLVPVALGGLGLDAQWCDDFHHSLHTLLTGERSGYYEDFGETAQFCKSFREGFVYTGQYSRYRKRRHGNSGLLAPSAHFVVCSQNHDQIGNRLLGERLTRLADFASLKLAAGTVLLSPFIPLLFMGEEYGEPAPFPYFVSHSDPALIEAVRAGRRKEFAAFNWVGEMPDPQAEQTFLEAKLRHELSRTGHHRLLRDFHAQLISLRRSLPAFRNLDREALEVACCERENSLSVLRRNGADEALVTFNFAKAAARLRPPASAGRWRKLLESSDERWGGAGIAAPSEFVIPGGVELCVAPRSFCVFVRDAEV